MKRESRRTQRKPGKQRRSARSERIKHAAPRTANDFFARSKRFQDRWIRVTHAVSKMRSDHMSLQKAAREYGLGRQTVIRLAGSALRKRPNGAYATKGRAEVLRVLVIPQPCSTLPTTPFPS